MQRLSIYDCAGQDGKDNKKAFDRLPSALRLLVIQTQTQIQQAIELLNPGRHITPTSGFRSPRTTARYGGQNDSLHHWGFARDYRVYSSEPLPLIVPFGMECLRENDHWHIAYKRGL